MMSIELMTDSLTRVPQKWLTSVTVPHEDVCAAITDVDIKRLIAKVHRDAGHPGVRRTLYFAKQLSPMACKRTVRQTVADCQTSADIVELLECVFCERGAPEELLVDNDTAFRSRTFSDFARRWNVRVIAARKGCPIIEAVHLYNITPRNNCTESSALAAAVYKYNVRVQGIDQRLVEDQPDDAPYHVDDKVWVRPPKAWCDSRFRSGTVTGSLSRHAVYVD
ncbi:hypothetical protein TTRE_0000922201 [Trichuris trichiura]|uniref:Uncharacterized protein n=1 Tax=Trichuris trichiura TaxID=36087 RepID=A0A077ZM47_TRITR|nr:hypothetical protein TTRE_0000922201 [Trichuris trichiura]